VQAARAAGRGAHQPFSDVGARWLVLRTQAASGGPRIRLSATPHPCRPAPRPLPTIQGTDQSGRKSMARDPQDSGRGGWGRADPGRWEDERDDIGIGCRRRNRGIWRRCLVTEQKEGCARRDDEQDHPELPPSPVATSLWLAVDVVAAQVVIFHKDRPFQGDGQVSMRSGAQFRRGSTPLEGRHRRPAPEAGRSRSSGRYTRSGAWTACEDTVR
jgi:hypothetical protein